MREKLIDKGKMSEEKNKTSKEDLEHTWSQKDKELFKSRYGCEVLKQNCTLEETLDKNIPSDVYIVTYKIDDKIYYDLTRSNKRSSIFDMYYDNLGPVICDINWGHGTINPRNWEYQVPQKKKRK